MIEYLTPKQACITVKDHKDNPHRNTKCRLLNSAKTEIRIISKYILHRILSK